MENINKMDIKSRTYYFFDGMINIENFIPDTIKIDKSCTKTVVFIILNISQWKILIR